MAIKKPGAKFSATELLYTVPTSDTSHYAEFEFAVINDDFERALVYMHSVVAAQRLRLSASLQRLATLLPDLLATS